VVEWQAVEAPKPLALAPFRVGLARLVDADDARRWDEPARSAFATLAPGLGRGSVRFASQPALVAGLVAVIERVARERPLLLAIDDLSWLGAPSKDVLQAVACGLPDRPILLATTFRDDEPLASETVRLADSLRHGDGLELRLAPLAPRDLERLVVGHLGGDVVSTDVIRPAHEQSAGNPLFCLELVRLWQDLGRIRLEDGRWTAVAEITAAAAPPTVRRLVDRRMESLPAETRDLLAAAAEMGPEIRFVDLVSAISAPEAIIVGALDTAMASGLLAEHGAGYAFAHPLYRVAVREAAGPARRDAMRLRIATALAGVEPEAAPGVLLRAAAGAIDPLPAAEHALAAAEAGDRRAQPLAIAFGFEAGERARTLFDRGRAIPLLERSLDAWRRLPSELAAAFPANSRYVSLIELNTQGTPHVDAATRAFREAVRTARDAGELAAAHATYFWLPYRRGDFDGAIGVLESGLRALPPDADVARSVLRSFIGWCHLRLRKLDEAFEMLQPATEVLEASVDRRGAMQALDFLGVLVRLRGEPEQGSAYLERSLRLAWELGDSRGEMLAELHLASTYIGLGRASSARPHAVRALEVARLTGDRYTESVVNWKAAELEDLAGDPEAAAALRCEELRLLAEIGGNPHNEALAHAHLANLAWRAGDDATFERESAAAVELAARSLDREYPARIRSLLQAEDWWRQDP
jgi:tetratricopeptide (TPR) repeat protein